MLKINKLKQLLCKHEWVDNPERLPGFPPMYIGVHDICKKCERVRPKLLLKDWPGERRVKKCG